MESSPSIESAFRLVTLVVEVTVNGAVPVATVEVRVVPCRPAVQAKAPLELVIVQPVEPEPPPRRISPVLAPPSNTRPDVEPSSEMS